MSKWDDDQLISYITTGLKMMVASVERVLEGEQRFWAYDDHYFRRRRPKSDVPPAAAREVVNPLIGRIDRAAGEQSMAYEALLTAQEVADFLGLERISVLNLVRTRHMHGVKVGSKTVVSLGELRRYLEEGPAPGMSGREDWRPLIEEFPGRRKRAELEAYRDEIRKRYDAVFIRDLDDELDMDIDPWEIVERMERKGLLEMYRPPDY